MSRPIGISNEAFLARLDLALLQVASQQWSIQAPSSFSSLSSVSETGSIELGHYLFCAHGKEECSACRVDHRDENCQIAGVLPVKDREPLSVEFNFSMYGEPQCAKHESTHCSTCLGSGFRKQLIKRNKEAKKQHRSQSFSS